MRHITQAQIYNAKQIAKRLLARDYDRLCNRWAAEMEEIVWELSSRNPPDRFRVSAQEIDWRTEGF